MLWIIYKAAYLKKTIDKPKKKTLENHNTRIFSSAIVDMSM